MNIKQLNTQIAEALAKYVNQDITPSLKKKMSKEVSDILKKYIIEYPELIDKDSISYNIENNTITINYKGLLEKSLKEGTVKGG